MTKEPVQATNNPFDALRAVSIRLLDFSKEFGKLALEVDACLSDAEKKISDNEHDTAKLKQLQTLLKSLG